MSRQAGFLSDSCRRTFARSSSDSSFNDTDILFKWLCISKGLSSLISTCGVYDGHTGDDCSKSAKFANGSASSTNELRPLNELAFLLFFFSNDDPVDVLGVLKQLYSPEILFLYASSSFRAWLSRTDLTSAA
jgi:hypothetical protein